MKIQDFLKQRTFLNDFSKFVQTLLDKWRMLTQNLVSV